MLFRGLQGFSPALRWLSRLVWPHKGSGVDLESSVLPSHNTWSSRETDSNDSLALYLYSRRALTAESAKPEHVRMWLTLNCFDTRLNCEHTQNKQMPFPDPSHFINSIPPKATLTSDDQYCLVWLNEKIKSKYVWMFLSYDVPQIAVAVWMAFGYCSAF